MPSACSLQRSVRRRLDFDGLVLHSWEKEHWKALLDDACEIFEEGEGATERLVKLEHFLGSLVVIPDGFAAGVVPI
jgi:hypothetical protein